jgi:hypothetical protein
MHLASYNPSQSGVAARRFLLAFLALSLTLTVWIALDPVAPGGRPGPVELLGSALYFILLLMGFFNLLL